MVFQLDSFPYTSFGVVHTVSPRLAFPHANGVALNVQCTSMHEPATVSVRNC